MIKNFLHTKLGPICLMAAFPLLVGCDDDSPVILDAGSGGEEGGENSVTGNRGAAPGDDISLKPAARALVMDFYLQDDTIIYNYVDGFDVVNDAVFNSANAAVLNDNETNIHFFPMLFRKTGDHEFQLQGNSPNRGRAFEDAVRALIGDPSPLGDAFRMRLLDASSTEANFSRIELQNMVDDINVMVELIADTPEDSGPVAYLLPDRDLIVDLTFCTFTISHISTSLNEELLRGEMDGSYTVDVTDARVIQFRRPTADELSHFNWGIRGYTPSHWLPYISPDRADVEGIQGGYYDMELGNIPIGPVR